MSPKEAIERQLPKPDPNGLRLINDKVEIALPLDLRCWAQIKAYKQEDYPGKLLISRGVVWVPTNEKDNSNIDPRFGEEGHFIKFMETNFHCKAPHAPATRDTLWENVPFHGHHVVTRGEFKVFLCYKKEATWLASLKSVEGYILNELTNLYQFLEQKDQLIKDRGEAMKSEGVEYFLRNKMENAAEKQNEW